MGLSSCMSCGGVFERGVTCPELSTNYALSFCVTCGPTFWNPKNYIEVQAPLGRKKLKPMPCAGCEREVWKVAINTALLNPYPMAFCVGCHSKLIQQHRWVEFVRTGREEDLKDYAPKKLGMGGGFEAHEVTGSRR